MQSFHKMLRQKWGEGKFVCIGLDSESGKIPKSICQRKNMSAANAIVHFNREIVMATHDLVCAYKPNVAFYEALGLQGFSVLKRTIADIHAIAPDVPVILDAKRADIGNTNAGYAAAAFDLLKADAITVHPYLGEEALRPFLDRADKGVIVLCRTSNPGAGEFQDLEGSIPLYQHVAFRVAEYWNKKDNCSVVVGATYPEELQQVRQIVGDMSILIPGIGAQGGDVEATVKAGQNSRGQGMIINASRSIIFASSGPDFAQAARRETSKLHHSINQYRN